MAGLARLVPPAQLGFKPPRSRYTPYPPHPSRYHRTIFISDTHLGTRGCNAVLLSDFLATNSCQTLYLVGDIVDGWQLKSGWYWSEPQSRVVNEILRKVDDGTRVIFVPGNHDEFLRPYCGRTLAGIEVIREAIHQTADGRRLWVIHGDQFDGVISLAKWLAHLGSWSYDRALQLNALLHSARRSLGLPYWSLSAWLKLTVKRALEYVYRFEDAVAQAAERQGLNGVVCGHIHHAQIRQIGKVLYLNTGDWVESCTALVEDAQGELEIVRWASTISTPACRGAEARREATPLPA